MEKFTQEDIQENMSFLMLLSRSFRNIAEASTEIINLEAILNLPKGTEHFLSDVHGEYEAFSHVLRNASGTIKRKVDEIFSHTLRESDKKELCSLIYYPKEKLQLVRQREEDIEEWYRITLNSLVKVCRGVSGKYTRSKVRKSLPRDFSYIIQELLHESEDANKQRYVDAIISTIISTRRADAFIIELCNLIQRLAIDSLHIVGDIYDRGPGAHVIMDILGGYHHFDIQWGNHEILWMGAASGNLASLANVLRLCMRYANLSTLEDGYGINLLPLATFAMETYRDDDCRVFSPRLKYADHEMDEKTVRLISQMHKAITVIQLKLEGALIRRHPEYGMDSRLLLDKVDYSRGTVLLEGREYELLDTCFPTVDPADPYRLTPEERSLMEKLRQSFLGSEKLNRHMQLLLLKGSMYLAVNSNLLYHASIPMNPDGSFRQVRIGEKSYAGKALLDQCDRLLRSAFLDEENPAKRQMASDYAWYLWCGPDAPTFDKDKMATFERYFIQDQETHRERRGCYFALRDDPAVCDRILKEFGIEPGPHSHIVTGHVPVQTLKGEQPVKAQGKLLVIDGGFSRAYQMRTGIAGYTLVYHSRGFELVQHQPFESPQKAIEEGMDIISTRVLVELSQHRMRVMDTDRGKELREQIRGLEMLLAAYRMGFLQERQ